MGTANRLAATDMGASVSYELFPPRNPDIAPAVWERIKSLAATRPDFFSVTYGASGSSRANSAALIRRLLQETQVPTVAHLTCVGATREELGNLVEDLVDSGVRDFLALRGDPPEGQFTWTPYPGGVASAADLVRMIREIEARMLAPGHVSISVAAYPVGEESLRAKQFPVLRDKQDAGADYAITQVFYRVEDYAKFISDCEVEGVHMPILPGILPLTDPARLRRVQQLSGVEPPPDLLDTLDNCDGDERLHRGIQATVELIEGVLEAGAPGIHLYTFNRDQPVVDILKILRKKRLPLSR